MTYASGKNAWGISDRSGRRYRLRTMKQEWTGSLVGPDEYESKQPQLSPPQPFPDPQALRNPRPDRVEPPVEVILRVNPFLTAGVGSNVLTVIQPGHSRKTGDIVRFRDSQPFQSFTAAALNLAAGYSITVTTDSQYTIAVSSQTATEANSMGGGGFVSAGPVTVEA
jgi:hypothetical protein|tara:strand:+ start:1052 stop:1552 length:501 start_codon:yes stop_codon:yes gene_type:complete